MTTDKHEKVIKYLTEEIRSLRLAPQINGCGPENWAEQLEVMESCLEAVRAYYPANIEREAWVSVEDRMPGAPGEYLVVYHPCHWDSVSPDSLVGTDTFRGKTAWAKKKYQRVTHWMPLPEPPESRPPEGEEGNQ